MQMRREARTRMGGIVRAISIEISSAACLHMPTSVTMWDEHKRAAECHLHCQTAVNARECKSVANGMYVVVIMRHRCYRFVNKYLKGGKRRGCVSGIFNILKFQI